MKPYIGENAIKKIFNLINDYLTNKWGNVENKSSAAIRNELTKENITSALNYTPLDSSQKGTSNGIAELDATGKVPTSQLPSYVDDVLEYSTKSNFPATGETGRIYVDTTTNLTYRWSGNTYVEISPSLALGETSSTAYRGDRGKMAYEHSQSTHNITQGGTGATTAKGAEYNLLAGMTEGTSEVVDNSLVTFAYTSPDNTQGVFYKKKVSYIWDYMKGKADSVYLKLSGGTISNANSRALNIKRDGTGSANIQFENSSGVLGAVGMNSKNGGLIRYMDDSSSTTSYTILDSGNYDTIITPENIGAAPDEHTHPYLPLTGGKMTGTLELNSSPVNDYEASTKKYIDDAYKNANLYTDTKIGELIGSAPETLDTIAEVADAIKENETVVTALNESIGNKADQVELDTHADNETIHITADERELWNTAEQGSKTYYGTCSTSSSTSEKIVTTIDGDFVLESGATIFIKFTNTNTASSPALKIDGMETSVKIYKYSTIAPDSYFWYPNSVVAFIYNGTGFIITNATTASTSYYGVTKLSSSTSSTSTSMAATPSAVKSAYDLANSKLNASEKGAMNGIAELDGTGKLPLEQLPIEVVEGVYGSGAFFKPDTSSTVALEKDSTKLYKNLNDNSLWVYNDAISQFVELNTVGSLSMTRYIDGMGFNGNENITHYATCSTDASTAAKTVTKTGFSLVTGATIKVKFTYTNTATTPTLNVNGTGAKTIYYKGSSLSTKKAGYLKTSRIYEFLYDGSYWQIINMPLDISDSTDNGSFSKNANLVTERDVYYGTPTINGSKTYTSNTNIYVPTSVGSKGQILRSDGSGAPSWSGCFQPSMTTYYASGAYENITTSDPKKLSFNAYTCSNSDFFALSNGGIKCLKSGVIEVCGAIYFSLFTSAIGEALTAHIYANDINSTICVSSIRPGTVNAAWHSVQISPKTIYVSENDILYLYGQIGLGSGSISTSYHATYMTAKYMSI